MVRVKIIFGMEIQTDRGIEHEVEPWGGGMT